MSYDASVQTLRCPFCGSEKLHAEKDARVLAPDAVVRLTVSQEDAMRALRKFMAGSFFRPSDLAEASIITKMVAMYVPFWVFSAHASTHWTADTNRTPPGARANWYPISGDHEARYENVIVGASGALTPAETAALCPFDLAKAVPASEIDLNSVLFEPFVVQRKYARPQAISGFEELERAACRQLVPGSARNVHVAVRLSELTSRPMLLPIWIMAYQYRNQTFRFLMNGQTGRNTGNAPTSMGKVALVAGGVVLAVILFVGIVLLCGGLLSRR